MQVGNRNADRAAFGANVAGDVTKIQIGARGSKNGPDWTAIDRFDRSDVIDHQWDLHALPIEDESVDCYVCNAVLEHVSDADLAVFEMFRTLRKGGRIWVEVPFSQPYHAHPSDFRRWTLLGLQKSMEDFAEVSCGIVVNTAGLVRSFVPETARIAGIVLDAGAMSAIEGFAAKYDAAATHPRFYSGVYFHGQKLRDCAPEKRDFMSWRRDGYIARHLNDLDYDPRLLAIV